MKTRRNRHPVSLRVSLTERCSLSCLYCRRDGEDAVPEEPVGFEDILALVGALERGYGLSKVALTGGEPLLREGVTGLVRELVSLGLADVAVTTNAQRLAAHAFPLRRVGLHRVNISLDSLDPATYRRLTRGGTLERTLAGIDAALRAGFDLVKLNMVVLRGVNDREVVPVARFAFERGCRARFLELMPVGVAAARYDEWFVPSAEVQDRLAAEFELDLLPVEPGSSSRGWRARDRWGLEGIVGFISPCTEPFCAGCRRLRLTASGRLLGCLAQSEGVDVRPLLRAGDDALFAAVEHALTLTRAGRDFPAQQDMIHIGG